ncbi:PhnD/SsuA/transferrin family substrate-binding protein [Nocardia neocaledoniensis]|uniref:PhnD/SsuA/transferrin family substrate-binding protein n=1 Tax=Nocardia neocaledoniensis TaxID=236511 RepID=UPI002453D9FE|nr:PhnD/SsuA/transferrin family substrate-binding protein [Nocardia neocaledoniensis]
MTPPTASGHTSTGLCWIVCRVRHGHVTTGETEDRPCEDQSECSSVFVGRTNSDIDSIDDLRGRKIAFVDTGSTSGNYIPKLMLKRAGIDPNTGIRASTPTVMTPPRSP